MAINETTLEKNTIYAFAEALSNENAGLVGAESTRTGGNVGDQLGGELSIRPWYQHGAKWAKIYRVKDPEIREKMAKFMEDAILNGWVGYSQSSYDNESLDGNTRHSFHRRLKEVGYDANRVQSPCGTDCSTLVFSALRYALGSGFKIFGETENDVPTMTIDGKTYCTDFHRCDKVIRTNGWLPSGNNFDWIFERALPLMGYEVDVFTMPNKGFGWRWAWPTLSAGLRFAEIAALDDPAEITPKAIFGIKGFRVVKNGSSYSVDLTADPIQGVARYRHFDNYGRMCHSPYDYIRQTVKASIEAFNQDYIGRASYISYATGTKCATPFDAYIDPDSGQSVNLLEAVSGATVTDPHGGTGCQVYQLVHDVYDTAADKPVYDETLDGNPPIYCGFFDPEDDTYNGLPLLGVNMTNEELGRLQENLHIHLHGVDGFDLYDYVVNNGELKRGDVVRTRAYTNMRTKYRYSEDASGESAEGEGYDTEQYLSSSGHIAIWI